MFTREELSKENKDSLITRVIKMEKENFELSKELYAERTEKAKSRFEDYMYDDYIKTCEHLKIEKQHNEQNCRTIQELEIVLEKYKNIVDKLGGTI